MAYRTFKPTLISAEYHYILASKNIESCRFKPFLAAQEGAGFFLLSIGRGSNFFFTFFLLFT